MRKNLILLISALFLMLCSSINAEVPQGVTLYKNSNGYTVNFSLPQFSLNSVRANNQEFVAIQAADYGTTNEIGYPALPQATFFLAIPNQENSPVISVKFRNENTQTLQRQVFPFQMPWEKDRPLADRPFSMNTAYYQTSGAKNVPFIKVSEPFVIAGVKGVSVSIYPFTYNPADNKLTYTSSASFDITVKGTADYNQKFSAQLNDYFKSVFANYEGYSSKQLMNYLIITAPDFEAGMAPFIAHKSTQGYNVTMVNTNVAGTTTTAIKAYLQARYNDPQTKPEYILLVGDVDKIPYWVGTGSSTPSTDLNYALLEGTDMFADAFVGRFPITTTTELSNLINKTIYMETYVGTLTKKNVFMASTDNYSITEGTHNYVISTYFQPNNYTNLKLYTQTYGATTAQLSAALNDNQIFAIYSGHGSTTSWADGPVFTQSDVRALTNTVYPYVYSFACITGSYHQASECFAETWVRIPKGGSSFYGSSVNSYWEEDDILERALIKALFDDNLAKVTPMMDKAKYYFVQHYGSLTTDVKRYLEMYNLMGDPSLPTKKVVLPDNTPPAPVTNLAAVSPTSSSMKLTWSAPYDSTFGGITAYDIRFSTSAIDSNNFNSASSRYYGGQSDTAGASKSYTVDSLLPGTTYYFAIKAKDIWNNTSAISNVASKATLAPPVLLVTPESMQKTMLPQTQVIDSVMIKNNSTVPSTMNYSVELANNTFPGKVSLSLVPQHKDDDGVLKIKNSKAETFFGQSVKAGGGPDAFGYKWIDSDDPNGPQYVWEDISGTGTQATNWVATGTYSALDEGYVGPIQLGFNFKFYGQAKTQVYISSNGLLVFNAPASNIFSNVQIPTADAPNEMIAPLWDDLTGTTSGTVHYKQDGNRFIVQFTNWQKYSSSTSALTFQIVLYSSGKIMCYYKTLTATLNECTVGIENAAGTTGLQVAYNSAYLKNNLALKFAAEPDWLASNNASGTLYNGSSAAVKLTFRSEDFPAGNYSMDLKIKSTDPQRQLVVVPIKMIIANPTMPVTVTSPNGGENWTVGSSKNITWNVLNVSSVNIKYSTDNGTNWLQVASGLTGSAGTFAWTVPNTPSTQCLVKVISAASDTVFDVSNGVFTISAVPTQITWQNVVNVKDNGNLNMNVTFGAAPGATNGIDAALGEVSLPPAPPAGVLDVRFELPVTPAENSLKDYRRDTLQVISWLLRFQPGPQGYPMTFTWTPANLPQGSFTLKDAVTGTVVNVDMKAVSSYTLTNTGITSLKIEYTKQLVVPVAIISGWNMVSVPVAASDMSASAIFPQANSAVFGYNNGYVPTTTLSVGAGYWVRYPSSATLNIAGSPAAANTVPLIAGWNMIGVHNTDAAVSALTTTPANIVNSAYYGFNNGYQTASTLVCGKGYWVRTTQAGILNLPSGLAKEGNIETVAIPKEWSRITVSDATGAASTLYVINTASAANSFDLPPVPPTGVFDVRFGTQKNAETIGPNGQTVMINSAAYPVTIQAAGCEFKVTDLATNGSIVNGIVKDGEKLILSNNAVTAVVLQSSDRPVSYELLQNYPNPFNPTTTIRFGLPEKSNVTLTVYNQLGEKVSVVYNGVKEAGYHNFEWNGSGLSSGVYFYELRTEKFTSIKKLVLMK